MILPTSCNDTIEIKRNINKLFATEKENKKVNSNNITIGIKLSNRYHYPCVTWISFCDSRLATEKRWDPQRKRKEFHAIKTTETKNRRRAKGQSLPKITCRPATVFRGIATSCQQIFPLGQVFKFQGICFNPLFLRQTIFCWDHVRQGNTIHLIPLRALIGQT